MYWPKTVSDLLTTFSQLAQTVVTELHEFQPISTK
jgi:hypothetical protein